MCWAPHYPFINCWFQCLRVTSLILQNAPAVRHPAISRLNESNFLYLDEISSSFKNASVIKRLLQMQGQEPLAGFHADTRGWRRSQEKLGFVLFFSFGQEIFEMWGVSHLLLGKVSGQGREHSSSSPAQSQMDESEGFQAQHHVPLLLLSHRAGPIHEMDVNKPLVSSSTSNDGKATAWLAKHAGALGHASLYRLIRML